MNNSSRGRYPPGIGSGRGGINAANPSFQSNRPHQQYVQRNLVPQQFQQQQQWLRRNNFPGAESPAVDEVEKTVQSEAAIDPRFVFRLFLLVEIILCYRKGFYISYWYFVYGRARYLKYLASCIPVFSFVDNSLSLETL